MHDLTTQDERADALRRLSENLAKLDALNLPPVSEEEIEKEIQASRQDKARLSPHERIKLTD